MVRVGGGWDTLSNYLDKHDPCRCRNQHRSQQGRKYINLYVFCSIDFFLQIIDLFLTILLGAKLITKLPNTGNGIDLNKAQVIYER